MSSKDKLNVELWWAAYEGDVNGVSNFLRRGADPNYHNPQHNQLTPLHIAAGLGKSTVIPALIEAGADPNSTDESQWTPLHVAAFNGQSTVIPALIKAGADPNSTDNDNNTPLHNAAIRGHHESADTLLKSGAHVDAINKFGISPLHLACRRGRVNVVKLLLSYGADPSIINNDGKTPADMVKANDVNKQVILEALENAKQDYSGLVNKALNEGHIKARCSKLALAGAPATGKSSVIKLLMDEPPPTEHHSTSVATVPEVRRVATTAGFASRGKDNLSSAHPWEPVDTQLVKHMLARAFKDDVKPASSMSATEIRHDNESSSSSDDGGAVSAPAKNTSSVIARESISHTLSTTASEIVKILPTVKKSPELYQSHWVYTVDSGGQAAFLDIAPSLLRYNPVSILTLKLNEKLTDRPKFYFSFKGELIGEPVERQISNMQLLQSSFRSLTSIDQPHLRNVHMKCSFDTPSLLVLGTFYDKISECSEESLDDKNAALWSTLRQFRDVRLNYCEDEKKIIFPINTIARGETEKEMAELIRSIVCQSYIEADIPARWFLFKLDLEEFQKSAKSMVVSKNECFRIGEAIKMDMRDVEGALMYYHDLTIFLYFPKVLPNVVFLHPQPLFDKLSELISISFADAVAQLRKMKIVLPPDAHNQLKTTGTFKRDLLDCIPEGFNPDFTADDFLRLMEDIFVIAPLTEKGKFFLPSVLPTSDLLEEFKGPFLKNMDALVLTWEMKPLPQGIFPALVVNLLKRQVLPNFDLQQPTDSGKSSEQSLQYRNAIHLTCIDLGGAVLLVDAIYWLEIYYSGRPERCSAVRNAIFDGISDVVKKFNYKPILSMPQERFVCSMQSHPRDHLCRPDEDRVTLTCCRDGITVVNIDQSRQLPWINIIPTKESEQQDISPLLKKEPNLRDLLSLLADIEYEWHKIGLALEVEERVLVKCTRSNDDDGNKLYKVIKSWTTTMNTEITWENIIAAVEGPIVKHKATAAKIRTFLAKPEVCSKYSCKKDFVPKSTSSKRKCKLM